MTSLQIIPKWKDKSARFKGTIAAGEHVVVSIANDDNFIADTTNLRLRVVNPANGKTLAQFPMPEVLPTVALEDEEETEGTEATEEDAETWGGTTTLTCELNLNTDRMLTAVPPAANVPLLFVLDAYEGATDEDEGEFTLYFKDLCEVTHWPRRRGEDEPTNLDDYKDLIKDFSERLEDAETTVANAAEQATTAVQRVSEALTEEGHFRDSASSYASAAQTSATASVNAATAAQAAERDAEGHKNAAASSASNAEAAKAAAEEAAAEAQAALPLDKTLAIENKAAEAKAVGDAVRAEEQRAEGAESSLGGRIDAEAQARALLAVTVQTNTANIATNAANIETKADKSSVYTKAEVNELLAGGGVTARVVQELPQTGEAKVLYFVPKTGEAGDVHDEYMWIDAKWEKIGSTAVSPTEVVPPSTDPSTTGKAADAKATGDALAGKQPTISDLADIRSGAEAGATAVQPAALANYATTAALRYDIPAEPTYNELLVDSSVSPEILYSGCELADRTANHLIITDLLDELRLTFPAAVSGKVRDFGLRVEVSAGYTAPALVFPAGVTLENADGAIPALADGTADAKGVTLLYFCETAPGVFLVKGEQVKEVE